MVSVNEIKESFLLELSPFFERLESICFSIDEKYNEAAGHYGFQCTGCDENCCMTHFYHHTHIEFFYIVKGLRTLSDGQKQDILTQAKIVCENTEKNNGKPEPPKLMCPLNIKGKCIVYRNRPMICRMHGIPHELKKPGAPVHYGKGCNLFMENNLHKGYFPFDRTPFYFQIARLENEMKERVGLKNKFKKTIAEMLTA
jgi:Fe-S-cluster containining protein